MTRQQDILKAEAALAQVLGNHPSSFYEEERKVLTDALDTLHSVRKRAGG